ncbi:MULTISPECIES: DUF3861 domain-containing protein [Vibrio]|uniref:DUF3861 domain-containing protein n=1 Tax=Vibrio TaxID=662 RepID=UPI00028C16FF|nr:MULTISPECIES: DUF3861 domain-containing protein [Vibrio]EKM27488.1 protein of unknown function with PDB structure family protein [Vibrio sp. HENC-03]CAH1593546.1 conserved hypothetical protein [Vibrio owensii]
MRKDNHYRITIEEVNVEEGREAKSLSFEVQDREDMLNIVDKIGQSSGLEPADATRVGVALRLLGPVMMKDRKHPLFVDFMPHFRNFMQNMKSTVKRNLA